MPAFRIHPTVLPFAVCLCLLAPLSVLGGTVLAALLHEAGHLIAVARCRARVTSVVVLPFGAQISTCLTSPAAACLISAAGSVCNLLCAAVFWRVSPAFARNSLALGILNLLPVRGLDGGALLENLLLVRCSPATAEKVAHGVSCVTLFLLWSVAAYLLLCENADLSLFLLCVFLFADSAFCD